MSHGWTYHGHPCCREPGPSIGIRPQRIARCGGPVLCKTCALHAAQIHAGATQVGGGE